MERRTRRTWLSVALTVGEHENARGGGRRTAGNRVKGRCDSAGHRGRSTGAFIVEVVMEGGRGLSRFGVGDEVDEVESWPGAAAVRHVGNIFLRVPAVHMPEADFYDYIPPLRTKSATSAGSQADFAAGLAILGIDPGKSVAVSVFRRLRARHLALSEDVLNRSTLLLQPGFLRVYRQPP